MRPLRRFDGRSSDGGAGLSSEGIRASHRRGAARRTDRQGHTRGTRDTGLRRSRADPRVRIGRLRGVCRRFGPGTGRTSRRCVCRHEGWDASFLAGQRFYHSSAFLQTWMGRGCSSTRAAAAPERARAARSTSHAPPVFQPAAPGKADRSLRRPQATSFFGDSVTKRATSVY